MEGIKLGSIKGLNLSNIDFLYANLKKARLTNVNLGDDLMKVDLSRSRMNTKLRSRVLTSWCFFSGMSVRKLFR